VKGELNENRSLDRTVLLLLLAITLFGAAARWLPVRDVLWLDELHTSWVVSGKLSEVAPRAAMGNQSPVYFYGVWGVTQLFGQSELTLRVISLIAGVLLIPATFLLAARWTGSPIAGLAAAALVAIEREFLFYSTEARPYALAQLVGVIQVACFARSYEFCKRCDTSTQARWSDRLAMIASSVVLFYLHYTTALLFIAEAVAFVIMLAVMTIQSRDFVAVARRRGMNFVIDFAIVTVCCLPALPALFAIAERRQQWDDLRMSLPVGGVWRAMAVCIALPAILASVATLPRVLLKRRPFANTPQAGAVIIALTWLFVPGLAIVLLKRYGWANLIHLRYIIVTAVAPMVFAALICALAVGRRAQGLITVTIILAALFTSPWLASVMRGEPAIPDRNEDWQAAVEMINDSEASKDEPVFVCSGLVEDGFLAESDNSDFHEYCLFAVSGVYSIERSSREVYAIPTSLYPRLNADHTQEVVSAGGAWLVVRVHAGPIEDDFMVELQQAGLNPRRRSRHSFGTLTAIWIGVD
jgi:mannosyltransferase